jgi:hypothetical protein
MGEDEVLILEHPKAISLKKNIQINTSLIFRQCVQV